MNPDREQLVKELDLTQRINYEVIETLASLGPATFVISTINALLAFFILRITSSRLAITVWLFFMLAIIFTRLLLVMNFWHTDKEEFRIRPWIVAYLGLVYLTGAGWGLLPFTSAFAEESWAWGFIVFVIAGMAAGGLMTLYVMLSAVIPYLVFIMLPLIFVLASGDKPADFAMSVLGGLFLVTMVRSSYYLNNMVNRVIRLDAENQHLFEFLLKARRVKP